MATSSPRGQFDGVGQVLWAYGQHCAITRDKDFADAVYPSVARAVDWIHQARKRDPLHLMPSTRNGDNEDITGHVAGHNFWAFDGLDNAVALAKATGHAADADADQHEYDDFHATLMQVLERVTSKTGGYTVEDCRQLRQRRFHRR